ncbi:gliding motility-associated C-terminal domain-containing protein [Cellulophaga lytica]|uniref:T9SS type B sorting domain-containing protein n=1 Tax=Cellulophaga lytica TaxID=979 RepID=UPI0026E2E980|nr:gliding motility-associated C-terminal domain-containing protein [Cellulophaga lytica]MDO6851970.1 gliding motility-associated C-terminal domain-containing protein [Cellulophaga lytica]
MQNLVSKRVSPHSLICLLALFILTLLTTTVNAQINNTNYTVDLNSTDMGPCGGNNDGITTVGVQAKKSTLNTFKISFDLPDGVTYKLGTLTLTSQTGSGNYTISEFNTSDLNKPVFSIEKPANSNWISSDFVEFTFEKTAECEAVQYSYNGGLFKDVHTITYLDNTTPESDTDDNLTINSYSLQRAYLAVENIATENLYVGESTTRAIQITNSGNGSIESFDHVVTISDELIDTYTLSFNGTLLNPTTISGNTHTYQINLNDAPFAGQVGNGNNKFENETIILEEYLELENCEPNQYSRHSPRWGCNNGSYCQIGATIPGPVAFIEEFTNLTLQEVNNPRPRWDAPVTYTYSVSNTSSSTPSYNVNINIGFTDDDRFSSVGFNPMSGDDHNTNRILSNFRFTGGSAITPQRWASTISGGSGLGSHHIASDYLTTDPDGPGGLDDLDGDGYYDDLPAGESTEINVSMEMDPNNPSCNEGYAIYINEKDLHIDTWSITSCGSDTMSSRENIDSHYLNRESIYNYGSSEGYDLDMVEGSVFRVGFTGNFVASEEAPTCNGTDMFSNDISTRYVATLEVPAGITLDTSADSRYTQVGNIITFRETNLADFMISSKELVIPVEFPITIDCSIYSGPSNIQLPFTSSYESSCYTTNLHCGSFEAVTHCGNNGCVGPTTTSFNANRETAGYTDASMSTRVTLDPNTHATNYYMPKDQMVVTSEAKMVNDERDNLYFEMRYVTENGVNMDDIIAYENGTVTINDISTGTPQTFPLTVAPTITKQGTNNHFVTVDLSSYKSLISPTYIYGQGFEEDEISVELHFRFKDEFPQKARLYNLNNFQGRFYSLDATSTEIGCEVFNETAFFFQDSIYARTKDRTVDGCSNVNLTASIVHFSNLSDKFPNEFRPTLLLKSAAVQIPDGMHFNSQVLSSFFARIDPSNEYPTGSNGGFNFSLSGSILTITPGPNFKHNDQGARDYSELLVNISGTNSAHGSNPYTVSFTYDEFAYSDFPEENTVSDTKNFTYVTPDYEIISDNSILVGNSLIESFEIEICKHDFEETFNNWLRVDTGLDFTISNAYLVDGGTETPLNFTISNQVTYIEFGTIEEGNVTCKNIRFEGTYTGSSNKEIRVSHNYDCIGYPSNYDAITYFNEEILTLTPVDAAIQLQILQQPTSSVGTCEAYEVVLESRNAGEADLINPIINFDIPGDVSAITINSITIEYPQNSGNIQTITPTIVGNNVSINLLDHTIISNNNGLLGSLNSNSLEEQIAIVRLNLSPQCNYISNTGTTYNIAGNSPYGGPANGSNSRIAAEPIIITGAEPPYSTNTTIINSPNFSGCEIETVSVETDIIGGVTGSTDYIKITLPSGISYVDGSLNSTGTRAVTFISKTIVGDHEEIDLALPQGANSTDDITYNFKIESTGFICEGNYDLELSTYVTVSGLSCSGVSCGDTEVITGNTSTTVQVTKGFLEASSFTPSASYVITSTDTYYNIVVGLENTGTEDLSNGINYNVYCADASGVKTGNIIYSGSLSQAVPFGGSIEETIEFRTTEFCGVNSNIVVEFLPTNSNCFCTELLLSMASSPSNNYSDLEIEMTSNVSSANPSENIIFTIDVENLGAIDATNIELQNVLAPGYTFVSATNGGTLTGNTISWSNFNLENLNTTTFSYTVTVNDPSGLTDEYTNVAQITQADQIDPDSTPNNYSGTPLEDDEAVLSVSLQSSDISMVKRLSATSNPNAVVGETISFEIEVTTTSSSTNVSIQDIVPIGFTVIQTSISNGGSLSGNTISWDIPSINATTLILQYNATVNTPTGAVDEYKNTAQITDADQIDPDSTPNNDDGDQSEDDESSFTLNTPITETDLELSLQVSTTDVNVGDVVTFTLNVTNNGAIEATGINIEDYVPAGYTVTTISNGGSNSGNTISWPSFDLDSGLSTTFTYQATVNAPTGASDEYLTVAQVTAADQIDPDSTPNNFDGVDSLEDDEAMVVNTLQSSDISMVKRLSASSNPNAIVGEVIGFEIEINTTANTTNIVVEDIVPIGFSVIQSSINNGGSLSGNTISWSIPSINASTLILQYAVSVNAPTGAVDEYKNIAQITAVDQIDPDSRPNNDDGDQSEDDESYFTLNTPIDATDIELSLTTSNTDVNVGGTVTYTLTVTNSGVLDATGINIENYVPAGVTVTTISNGGTITNNTINWPTFDLSSGSSTTYTYQVTVNAPTGADDEYITIAQITTVDQNDSDSTPNNFDGVDSLEDDEAAVGIDMPTTDISISKTVDFPDSNIGDTIAFTITATNNGSFSATNISIQEILPNGYSFNSATTTIGIYDESLGEWTITSLDANETATLVLNTTVIVGENYLNTATLSYLDQIDDNSSNDTDTAMINISEDGCLKVYNEFSPNGDNSNDTFYIECIEQYPNNYLQIYNRWGVKVYEQKGYKNTWNGTSQGRATIQRGEKMPVGTYYYTLELRDNKTPSKSGWLYLTR